MNTSLCFGWPRFRYILLGFLAGCGPTSIVVDGDPAGNDSGIGDTDTSDTGSADTADTGSDSADTADTADSEPAEFCFSYGVIADHSATLAYGATFDSYDATMGAYDASTAGSDATIAVNGSGNCALTNGATVKGSLYVGMDPAAGYCEEWGASVSGGVVQLPGPAELPTVGEPAGMPASEGDVYVQWGEARSFDGDEQFGDLRLAYGSSAEVTTTSRLLVGSFANEGAPLTITKGAALELYVTGDVTLGWGSAMNVDGLPRQLRIYVIGPGTVSIGDGTTVNAEIYAPSGTYTSAGTLSGNIVAKTIKADWGAAVHVDMAGICP